MHDDTVYWPETQTLQGVQETALEVLVNEVPVPHWAWDVLPVGQKFPAVQFDMVDGVLQYDPGGQGFCDGEPAGQYLVGAHAVAMATPKEQ
jgi:hypothetical protein